MGARPQSAYADKHRLNEWCGLIFSAIAWKTDIARWGELQRKLIAQIEFVGPETRDTAANA